MSRTSARAFGVASGREPSDSFPVGHHELDNGRVETTQIAPTILRLLGLDPDALQAVQVEHTRSLSLR